jgi:peptide deformylase
VKALSTAAAKGTAISNLKIVEYPHPALLHSTEPVKWIDKDLRLLVGRMFESMYEARGLGLAANQVATPIRLLVMNVSGDSTNKEAERVYLNPHIVDSKGTMEGEEGCLSFPGLFVNVRRAKKVKIRAIDLSGASVEFDAENLESRAWQHEIDHLDGVVFCKRFSTVAKLTRGSDVKLFERRFEKLQQSGVLPSTSTLEQEIKRLKSEFGGETPVDVEFRLT